MYTCVHMVYVYVCIYFASSHFHGFALCMYTCVYVRVCVTVRLFERNFCPLIFYVYAHACMYIRTSKRDERGLGLVVHFALGYVAKINTP